MGKEGSNKIIIILAILLVIAVAVSSFLLVDKLSALESSSSNEPQIVRITETIREGSPQAGNVALTILSPGGT